MRATIPVLMLAMLAGSLAAAAGEADVENVRVTPEPGGTYRFDVTVRHADEGWDHYADRWEVVGDGGEVHATRVLLHPHIDEQPFERSEAGVAIPDGIAKVTVRAHDSVHGFGGKEMTVPLPGR